MGRPVISSAIKRTRIENEGADSTEAGQQRPAYDKDASGSPEENAALGKDQENIPETASTRGEGGNENPEDGAHPVSEASRADGKGVKKIRANGKKGRKTKAKAAKADA